MLKQKKLIVRTLVAYVVLTSLHRLFDNYPITELNLFVFSDKLQDLQWYIKDTFSMIGFSVIIYALHSVSQPSLKFTTGLFLANSILQLPLYYLCYLRYDVIVNFLIIVVILLKIKFDEKRIDRR